jgi:hypothetical protein
VRLAPFVGGDLSALAIAALLNVNRPADHVWTTPAAACADRRSADERYPDFNGRESKTFEGLSRENAVDLLPDRFRPIRFFASFLFRFRFCKTEMANRL